MYDTIKTTFTRRRIVSDEFWKEASTEQQLFIITRELREFMLTDLETISSDKYIYQEGDKLLLTNLKIEPIVVNLGQIDYGFDAFRLQIKGTIVND